MYSLVETFLSLSRKVNMLIHYVFFKTSGCDIGCHWCDEKKLGRKKNILKKL